MIGFNWIILHLCKGDFMKNKYCLLGLLFLTAFKLCYANPFSMAMISRISAYPPEIELYVPYLYGGDSVDVSGYMIYTSSGTAVINQGTVMYDEWITFDSSNTSGFVINAEADSVYLDIQIDNEPPLYESVKFGNWERQSPPIKGHSTSVYAYFPDHPQYPEWPWFFLSFDFATPDLSWTDIIINEINAHGTWQNESGFIELYNKSNDSRSLDGWQIVCDTIYSLPADAIIPSHGFYVIDGNDFPGSFDMDYALDNIYLISPDSLWRNPGPRLVDQVGWSSDHGENVSFMRYPDGDAFESTHFYGFDDTSSTTFENGFPTRGAANRHDCPGFVAIGARADSIDEGSGRIHWTDPIWDEGFDYSVLVNNDDHFPQTYDDGNIIYQGTNQQFNDLYIPPVGPTFYTVFAHNIDGSYSTPTEESMTYIFFNSAGIDERSLPENIGYLNCYPNPFNAQTTISFSIAKASNVKIAIYDIAGRLVETVADGYYAAGEHAVIWDAGSFSSGTYFAKLSTESNVQSEKLVLLK